MIEKLENNEHILLMYLADELPAGDRADVERMLAADPSLRRDWQELQTLHMTVGQGLGRLDEISPMPVNADFAVRQIGRAMRQKMAQPAVASAAASERTARSWWWLYPTVTAASIAIIAMVWLNRQQSPTSMPAAYPSHLPSDSPEPLADSQNANEADDELLIDSFTPPLAGSEQKDARAAEDDSKQQVASGDAMPQDEISQYLLSATTAGQ